MQLATVAARGRRRMRYGLWLAAAVIVAPATAAQRPAPGPLATIPTVAGDTVRLHQHDLLVVRGTLAGADSAALLVVPARNTDTVRYRRTQFDRAEVLRGRHRRGGGAVRKGIGVGSVVGVGIIGLTVATHDPQGEGVGEALSLMAGLAAPVIGAVIGGVRALTHAETWVPFDARMLAPSAAR